MRLQDNSLSDTFSFKSGEQISWWMSPKVILLVSPVLKGDTGRRMNCFNYLSMQQWFYKFKLEKGSSEPSDSVRHLEKLCVFSKVSFLWLYTAFPMVWSVCPFWQQVLSWSDVLQEPVEFYASAKNFHYVVLPLDTSLYWARVSITIFMPWHPDAENLFLFTWKKQSWNTLIRWSLLQIYTAPTSRNKNAVSRACRY